MFLYFQFQSNSPGFFLAFLLAVFLRAFSGSEKLGFTLASIWLPFAQLFYWLAQCQHCPCHGDHPVSPPTAQCPWLLGLMACASLGVHSSSQDPQLGAIPCPQTAPPYLQLWTSWLTPLLTFLPCPQCPGSPASMLLCIAQYLIFNYTTRIYKHICDEIYT